MNKRSYKVPFIVSMIFNVLLVTVLVAAGAGMQKSSDLSEESSAALPSAEIAEYDYEAIPDGEDLVPADEAEQTTSAAAVTTTTTTTAAPTTTTTTAPVTTTTQTSAKKTTAATTAKPTTTTAKPTTTTTTTQKPTTTTTQKPTTTTTKGSGDNDGSWADGWY